MSKKHVVVCMAFVALAAFALPAVASATTNPEITHPTGTRLATGTKIKATNIGLLKFLTPGGVTLFECSTATMTGTLTRNNGTETEAVIESTSFSGTAAGGACTSSSGNLTFETNIGNGTPWCLRATSTMAADEFQIRGNSCGNEARPLTIVTTSSTAGTCKYNRGAASPLKGKYKTDTAGDGNSDAVLSLSPAVASDTEFTKEEGGFLCPSAYVLEMSFTFETDTATSEPLYIS